MRTKIDLEKSLKESGQLAATQETTRLSESVQIASVIRIQS